jgi:hypothetical protein
MNTIAAILAFLIGIMSIVAGGKVIRGWEPGWSVLTWLPIYNVVMGILAFIPALMIWINQRYAFVISGVTFGIHAAVLLMLIIVFRNVVAMQSLAAMAFRLATWAVILALLYFAVQRSI